MVRFVKGCSTPQSQRDGSTEPQNTTSVLPARETEDIKNDEVAIDPKPLGLNPSNKSDTQKKKADCEAEYADMELLQVETLEQNMMPKDVHAMITCACAAQCPKIMASWLQEI